MSVLAISLLFVGGLVNFATCVILILPKHDENNYVLLPSNLTVC